MSKLFKFTTILLLSISVTGLMSSCDKEIDTLSEDLDLLELKSSEDDESGDDRQGDKKRNHGKKSCFDIVYPISMTLPDGTVITGERDELHESIKEWREANPDVKEKAQINFPISIQYPSDEEGVDPETVEIADEEALKAAIEACPKGDKGNKDRRGHGKKACFKIVYPISMTLPDGEVVSGDRKELDEAIKAWREANPEVKERPQINFPISIQYPPEEEGGDPVVVEIADHDALEEAMKACKDDNRDDKKPRTCFKIVYPISMTLPDGSVVSGDRKELNEAIKAWRNANPDVKERAQLNFPLSVEYRPVEEGGDPVVVEFASQEEFDQAVEDCGK